MYHLGTILNFAGFTQCLLWENVFRIEWGNPNIYFHFDSVIIATGSKKCWVPGTDIY